MRGVIYGLSEDILSTIGYCSECGTCEHYACPFDLSPRRIIAELKQTLTERGMKFGKGDLGEESPWRDGREVPLPRLLARTGLDGFYKTAMFREMDWKPEYVRFPLKQWIGVPCTPVVSIGDRVSRGDVIGEVEPDKLGVCLSSSVDGVVESVDENQIVIRVG